MMDIKIFQEKLEQILAQAREQDKTLSGQDIREVFGEELSASQMQSLLEYLRLQGIRLDVTQSLAGDGRMFEGRGGGRLPADKDRARQDSRNHAGKKRMRRRQTP